MLNTCFAKSLSMTRGDTARFKFQRLDADGEVILSRPDSLYFTVKSNTRNQSFKFQKTLEDMTMDSDGTYHFTILPTDTNELAFGRYYYDLEVIEDGVKTTVSIGNFIIGPEVTYASNEGENQ